MSWTILMSTPAARWRVAAKCLRSCSRIGRQPGQVGELLEQVGHERRVQRLAGLGGELEPRSGPLLARGAAFLVLAPAVGAQHLDCAGVEGDLALAGVGLGGALAGFPAELGDLPADGRDGGVQVGVGAAQPAGLAAAQPRKAIRWYSAYSRCRRAWRRNTAVWAGVHTMTGDGRGVAT